MQVTPAVDQQTSGNLKWRNDRIWTNICHLYWPIIWINWFITFDMIWMDLCTGTQTMINARVNHMIDLFFESNEINELIKKKISSDTFEMNLTKANAPPTHMHTLHTTKKCWKFHTSKQLSGIFPHAFGNYWIESSQSDKLNCVQCSSWFWHTMKNVFLSLTQFPKKKTEEPVSTLHMPL